MGGTMFCPIAGRTQFCFKPELFTSLSFRTLVPKTQIVLILSYQSNYFMGML